MGQYIIDFEMIGTGPISEGFKTRGRQIEDLSPAWKNIANKTIPEHVKKTFESEGGFVQDKWAELKPKYKAWKELHFPGRPILVRTGLLKESLLDDGMGAQWHVETISKNSLEWGTKIPYGIFHQMGAPANNLPQRIILKVTDSLKNQVVQEVRQYVYEVMGSPRYKEGHWNPGWKIL